MSDAQEIAKEFDENQVVIAKLVLTPTGISFRWMPFLFAKDAPPLDPEIRADIVEKLRLYAAKLESGELDERMKGIAEGLTRATA